MPKINLDNLREKIDIVEIISEHVNLKQKNDEYTGLCPFHDEKSPSFTVNAPKGVFFCFGCGEKGDAISFLMSLNRTNFTETVLSLAERYDVPVLEEDDESSNLWRTKNRLKKQLIEVNEVACQFFTESMGDRSTGYLNNRGITEATCKKFRLGYAPSGWQNLVDKLSQRFDRQILIQSGLVGQKDNHLYDLFRDRLMVPIFNPQGQVVGFSGRVIDDDNKPKYLNTPETEVFKKSEVIFPLHLARKEIVNQDRAILVEGNFDVIKLHQAGFSCAIATLGTAIDNKQLTCLARLTPGKTLILALDNDQAGIKGTNKVLDSHLDAIGSGLINFKILALPTGFKDVDEVISTPNGLEVTKALIEEAPLWVDWRLNQILATYSLEQAEQFHQCSKAIANLLKQIKDPSLKSFYLSKCSKILARGDSDPEIVNLHRQGLYITSQTSATHTKTHEKAYTQSSPLETKIFSCEMILAKVILFYPEQTAKINTSITDLNWFIRDKLCRWVINRASCSVGTTGGTPAMPLRASCSVGTTGGTPAMPLRASCSVGTTGGTPAMPLRASCSVGTTGGTPAMPLRASCSIASSGGTPPAASRATAGLSLDSLVQSYSLQNTKVELQRLLDNQELFSRCSEFINLDFKLARRAISAQAEKLFSCSEAEIISISSPEITISSAIKELSKVKIIEQINIYEIMIKSTENITEQLKHLEAISILKQQLIDKKN